MNFQVICTVLFKPFFSSKFQVGSWRGEPICAWKKTNLLHINLFLTLIFFNRRLQYCFFLGCFKVRVKLPVDFPTVVLMCFCVKLRAGFG